MSFDNLGIVSFSGVDGAGKSTQIDALREHLEGLGLRCSILTFWDNVVAFSRFRERVSLRAFKGDQGIGSPENPIQRRDKNVSAWYITAARLCLYALDACSLCVAVTRALNSDADVIIFDRYIYDELANLPLQYLVIRIYVRLLLEFVPRPDLAFLLDADPEAAAVRKPEYPIDFVRRNREAYLRLSRFIGGITVIPPLPLEKAAERIRELLSANTLQTETGSPDFQLQFPITSPTAKTSNS